MFDNANPTFKRRLAEGGGIGFFWFAFGSPSLVEMAVSGGGADSVVLDLQHGLFDRHDLEAAISVIPPSVPCIVRIEDDTPTAVARALDAGAEGVLVPMVETAAQASAVAREGHYPPRGRRSGGGMRPLVDFGAYRAAMERGATVGVMIETAAGLANAREIAAAEGVDYVFIGSGDLALSLGTTPETTGELEEAFRTIREACAAAGKPCGIFTMDAAAARKRTKEGFALTVLANDLSVVIDGFRAAHAAFAQSK